MLVEYKVEVGVEVVVVVEVRVGLIILEISGVIELFETSWFFLHESKQNTKISVANKKNKIFTIIYLLIILLKYFTKLSSFFTILLDFTTKYNFDNTDNN